MDDQSPRYPSPLIAGSRIAVTAPSSGVAAAQHARLDLVMAHLRSQGFHVEEGQCLRSEQHSASALTN
jgi:muramoyltetrapeptide carboxypeptidase